MSLYDINAILNKEAIIATYPAQYLRSMPDTVEQMYKTHALTHISLGDTSKYVDIIFKWLGGQNKGTFIGAVVGDYGHGKTSFQVHVWDQCVQRKIFAVPPFSWKKVAEMIDGTAAWVHYILSKEHPEIDSNATKLYERFKEQSLRQQAEHVSFKTKEHVEKVMKILETAGSYSQSEATPEHFLDYCAELTEIIQHAGYSGLLVLLDEPEVAAKELSAAAVSQILFNIANGLLQRQGNFGVFISMPENFLASAQRTFASLSARLQGRHCMPRLRDIYGTDFPQKLWSRYVEAFQIGHDGENIVSPETLHAIGQVASSSRRDLSYGPRTVISAFRRMIYHYNQSKTTYEPIDFIDDCLDDEILVAPNYPTSIRQCLESPESFGIDTRAIKIFAAFPNGISHEYVEKLGIEPDFVKQAKRNGLVYKRGDFWGLTALTEGSSAEYGREPHIEAIEEISDEYAPSRGSLAIAKQAFITHIIPVIFEKRTGQQLLGWDYPERWNTFLHDTEFAEFVGAFRQTEKEYPKRRVMIAISSHQKISPDEFVDKNAFPPLDILIHFILHWNKEESLPEDRVEISVGDPHKKVPAIIRMTLDLAAESFSDEQLEQFVDRSLLTPLGILYLIGEMDRRQLPHEYESVWKALQQRFLRTLTAQIFGDPDIRNQAIEQTHQKVMGSTIELVGMACLYTLRQRYPEYSTLILQPRWETKVQEYISILHNQNIPLACKRGREIWKAPKSEVARAFNTTVMNLENLFSGYENLIAIDKGKGKTDDASITFKVHPLEETITDHVMADRASGTLKIEGKECWWIDFDEIRPLMMYSGYQPEELLHIIEMGKSRGSFFTDDHLKGRRILYCKPLDLEQMKLQLREKLHDLKTEIQELQKLPNFRHSFNFDKSEKNIEHLHDENEFDSLLSSIHREFEKNHDRLPSLFDALNDALNKLSTEASKCRGMLNSRQVVGLKSAPTASSRWCADLNEYVVTNLKTIAHELTKKSDSVLQEAKKSENDFTFQPKGSALEKISLLQAGWLKHYELENLMKDIMPQAQQITIWLTDYEQWRKLLNQSDELYTKLLELKEDSIHEAKGNELLKALEKIWDDISTHLKIRNVQGLGNYNQYVEQLKELYEQHGSYLRELSVAFNRQKEQVNRLFQNLAIGGSDYRVNEVFNPSDVQGCYERLFAQAASHLKQAYQKETDDLVTQQLEVVYARDILKSVSGETAFPLLDKIHSSKTELDDVIQGISEQWIQEVIKDAGEPRLSVTAVKDTIAKVQDACKEARNLVRQSRQDNEGISQEARLMLALIPDKKSVDLKHVVLTMMKEGETSSDVLGAALKCLSELFRTQQVQIKVELPHR